MGIDVSSSSATNRAAQTCYDAHGEDTMAPGGLLRWQTLCMFAVGCSQGPDPEHLPDAFRLALFVKGPGEVVTEDGALSCPPSCSRTFPVGTVVRLRAAPTAIGSFDHWEGACSGDATGCELTLDNGRVVTAVFADVGGGSVRWSRLAIDPCRAESFVVALSASGADEGFWVAGHALGPASFGGALSEPVPSFSLTRYLARYAGDGSHVTDARDRRYIDELASFSDGGVLLAGRGILPADGDAGFDPCAASFTQPAYLERHDDAARQTWLQGFDGRLCASIRVASRDWGLAAAGSFVDFDAGQGNSRGQPFALELDARGVVTRESIIAVTPPTEAGWTKVASTESGLIALAGIYRGTLLLDGGQHVSNGQDGMMTLVRRSGEQMWWRELGGAGADVQHIEGLAVSESGETYVAGDFIGTLTLDTFTVASEGNEDVFIAAIGPNGDVRWLKSISGTGSEGASGLVLGSNGLIISATFRGAASLPGGAQIFGAGGSDVVAVGLNLDGELAWARTYGANLDDVAGPLTRTLDGNAVLSVRLAPFMSELQTDVHLGMASVSRDGGAPLMEAPGETVDAGRTCALLVGVRSP